MKTSVTRILALLMVVTTIVSGTLMVPLTRSKAAAETDTQAVQTVAGAEENDGETVLDELKDQMRSMLTIEAEAATSFEQATENYTANTYYPKVEKFLGSTGLWKISAALTNCHKGAQIYCSYMTGTPNFWEFPSYNNASEVLPGDVIQMKGHYFVVLDCSASGGRINLRTFETNWPNGSYTIGNGTYWVKDNQLHRTGEKTYRPFIQGWHIITSFYKAAQSCVDSNFYPAMYSDINSAFGTNYKKLFSHFMEYGIDEGRTASPSFDINVYSQQSDLKAAFGSNRREIFYHYIKYGIFEKDRKSSHFYTGSYYLNKYSDLQKAFGSGPKAYVDAATHFNQFGAVKEHRQATNSFSVEKYRRYTDLSKAFLDNWLNYFVHYLCFGLKEGRTAN